MGFTAYFDKDISGVESNPFHAETVFGTPRTIGIGNEFARFDILEDALQEIIMEAGSLSTVAEIAQAALKKASDQRDDQGQAQSP